MAHQALARTWRPQHFADLIGQHHVTQSLVNSINSQKLHHAYLFSGIRGVGKTTVARILARALSCEKGINAIPCDVCSTCKAILAGNFIDLIEVDAASRTKVEDTRDLLDNVQYPPTSGRFKIYLIDEVHMLSNHSFNALLKTLEEPPAYVKFLLATTDPQKLPATILSRLLQFHLKLINNNEIAAWLTTVLQREGSETDVAAVAEIAVAAQGSMRDALSLLEQALAYGNGKVDAVLVQSMLGTVSVRDLCQLLLDIADANVNAALAKISYIDSLAPNYSNILQQIIKILHQIAVIQLAPEVIDANFIDYKPQLQQLSQNILPEKVQLWYDIAIKAQQELKIAPQQKITFEMTVLRMACFNKVAITTSKSDEVVNATAINKAASITTTKSAKVATAPQQQKTNTPTATIRQNSTENNRVTISSAVDTQNLTWEQIAKKISLTGIAKSMVNECTMLALTKEKIVLNLAPQLQPLLNQAQQQKIEKAIQQLLGSQVKLEIKCGEHQQQTPIQIKQDKQQQLQDSATNVANKDANVQKLINTFDATIATVTPKKADTNSKKQE